jgi:VCBS repeat-containing protein
MKRKDLMLKFVAAVIALVLVWTLNPVPVQAMSVYEIAVDPERAANQVGTNHTITAVATAIGGEAVPGVPVHFSVIRGPNAGVVGDNITDVNGEASFTYTSDGDPGIDTIRVETLTEPIVQNWAKKVWLEPTSGQIETGVFLQSAASISFGHPENPNFPAMFTGITVVEIDLGSLADSDGNGLEEVSAEITMMELTGDQGGGYVLLRLRGPAVGKIEELTNNTSGVLDIPPFAPSGTAVSTFEFHFLLICLGYHAGNAEPVSLAAVIDHAPPEAATWYSENNPVIHIGYDVDPGPYDMYWDWFVLGDFSPLPEVQLELVPESATNPTGTDHTVTAVYTLNGLPLGGKLIGFHVYSGPNHGEQWQGYTDAEGKATFTYTGDGGEGTDIIEAGSFMTVYLGQYIHAIKVWETPNQPPVANNDTYSTDEDTTLNIAAPGMLGNDSDPDGDPLTVVVLTVPQHGSGSIGSDGSLNYMPDANFSGSDTFSYKASDGAAESNIATVNITVNPINDPPVASDDAATTDEDTAVTVDVLANDSDVDGDSLAVSSVTIPAHGAVVINPSSTVTYTPDQNYNGTDSFVYTVDDGNGGSDTATVTITVNPVNDPPVAHDDGYVTDEDTALLVAAPGMLGNDNDPDGDPLTLVVLTVPQHGSGSIGSDGSLNYMPDANFSGSDTFTYKASDGIAESSIATVNITVNPINDPPVTGDDAYSTDEDTPLNVGTPGVLGNDSDPEGDTISAIKVTDTSHGTLTFNSDGSFDYTPDADFSGSDSFTYKANDGDLDSNIATVTITVDPVNDPPVADPNGPYSGTVGVPVTFYGSNSSDCDGTIVSYDWDFGDGAAGSGVSPAHSYSTAGTYTVTLTVIDNDGASHMATTSVDIAEIDPEEMIKNLVDEIDGMDLPGGIKNSLTVSLDTAIKVLEDSNPRNDVAAFNILRAFIKKVEAQCGKKIPEEVADALIAKAQDIIMALSLGP